MFLCIKMNTVFSVYTFKFKQQEKNIQSGIILQTVVYSCIKSDQLELMFYIWYKSTCWIHFISVTKSSLLCLHPLPPISGIVWGSSVWFLCFHGNPPSLCVNILMPVAYNPLFISLASTHDSSIPYRSTVLYMALNTVVIFRQYLFTILRYFSSCHGRKY